MASDESTEVGATVSEMTGYVPTPEERYLSGCRLWVAGLGDSLGLSVFLPCMEVSIISTSLVTISNDLDDYNQSSWIVTSYLLTYTGFLIIWANLGDMFGVKAVLMASMVFFIAFSAGCGASQTMAQLIINRALQGIGGAGLYSLGLISFLQMVPASRYNLISAVASSAVLMGTILGPLIGGGINNSGDWRWAFFVNVPAGAVGLGIITFALPRNFPRHCEPVSRIDINLLREIDFLGAFLLLAGTILLVTALAEGQVRYAWNSAFILALFVLSGLLWIAFLMWQWCASNKRSKIQPMFPWRFFGNRVWLGVLLGSFLSGTSCTVAFIEIPQRFQIVNGNTPFSAGVRLLPFAVGAPLGSAIPIAMTKFGTPFIVCLALGASFQLVGFSLLSTIPTTFKIWACQHGSAFIAGFGTGASMGTQLVMSPMVVDAQDKNVAVGTAIQMRMLGGALGIATANTILNKHVLSQLTPILGSQVHTLLESPKSISAAPEAIRAEIRRVFGEAYNLQMRAIVAFCAVQVVTIMLVWKKKQIKMEKTTTARFEEATTLPTN